MADMSKADLDSLIEGLSNHDGSGLTGWRVTRACQGAPYERIAFDVSSPVGRERMEQLLEVLAGYDCSFGSITVTVHGRREAAVEAE